MSTRTLPVTGSGPLFALMPVMAVGVRSIDAPGKLGIASSAATESTRSAVPGLPVIIAFGPLLPEDATTVVPARAALLLATASGLSADPNGEPRDMLMTSMPSATARLIASTTTSVEPAHPKTRYAYSVARGATPGPMFHVCDEIVAALYGPVKVEPSDRTPSPAAVPATWDPCPKQSSGSGSGCGMSFGEPAGAAAL